jgi:hypothetical protein
MHGKAARRALVDVPALLSAQRAYNRFLSGPNGGLGRWVNIRYYEEHEIV